MTRLEARLERLRRRRSDPVSGAVLLKNDTLSRALAAPGAREALQYISESCEPVPVEYTRKTFEECARVQAQLATSFFAAGESVEFDHQGSVTNDTHIKLHSDIDLLTVTTRFFGVLPPMTPRFPYPGDPVADLRRLRAITAQSLSRAFPAATVDAKKARCVSIAGGSLTRKVDVVACDWLLTEQYEKTKDRKHLGIDVLDDEIPTRVANMPFLHNARIAERDALTGGALRRCIRLVKSVRYDAEEDIRFSSYDIQAVCYAMPISSLLGMSDVQLGLEFVRFGSILLRDHALRDGLVVPNDTRRVFGGSEGADAGEMSKLVGEMADLLASALPKAA